MKNNKIKVFLAAPRGFCAGVDRAIEIVKKSLNKYGSPVYVRHEIVHNKHVVESLKKTNKVVFIDEDVSAGATAYMMQKVLEEQKGYFYLDSEPKTISAKDHRPAYGEDGDYFSKPNTDDIFESVYAIMHDHNPTKYPTI